MGQNNRFLSLKWKFILLMSLALLVTDLAIILFADSRARDQFQLEQQQTMQRLFQTLQRQLLASDQTLGRVASMLPLLEVSSQQIPSNAEQRLQQVLQQHGAILQLEWDISLVRFLESGRLRANEIAAVPDLPEWLLNLARQAERQATQSALLKCAPDCYQYVATPLIYRDNSGVMLLGRSIADLVLEFHRLSNAHIAFIGMQATDSTPEIDTWGVDLMAISRPQTSRPLITALAANYSLRQLMERPRLLQLDDDWYLAQVGKGVGNHYRELIIYPVSEAIGKLQATRQDTIIIGLGGLILAELLVLLLLRQPMERLHALVGLLPGLAGNNRHKPEILAQRKTARKFADDEIDLLATSIVELEDKLRASRQARDEAQQHLLWLANHDSLTNLYNRRYFQQEFESMLARTRRYGRSGAILYLDLDQFKTVNDLSGHQYGDRMLQQVATRLRESLRESDVLARLGGDEFALLIPESHAQAARQAADKILRQLKKVSVVAKDHEHRISASIGIALFPEHGESVEELMANADLAMYQAKEKGRNRCHLFSSSDRAREHLDVRTRFQQLIDTALENGGLFLEYQPIMDVATRRIVRHEALVRLRGADGSIVPPDRFIGVAENTGQILDIDRWVVGRALQQLQQQTDLHLSVNLSGAMVDNAQMQAWLKQALPDACLRPGQLVIELTETAMVSNMTDAIGFMQDMQALGAQFALDDFGSGFATFSYLRSLPVEYVKIDGAFIQKLADNPDDQLFIKALVEVAHGLGKKTIAEYVDNPRTLELLQEYRVDLAQGFYIGRPAVDFAPSVWQRNGEG